MSEYRFYPIRKDGHVAGPPINRDAPDDQAAVAQARQLQDGLDIEIWQGARVVAYVVRDQK
jgi:hypothetical protein